VPEVRGDVEPQQVTLVNTGAGTEIGTVVQPPARVLLQLHLAERWVPPGLIDHGCAGAVEVLLGLPLGSEGLASEVTPEGSR